jgi:hypothetical protein
MIRDLELLRKILIHTEQVPPGQWKQIAVEGASPEEIFYHAQLASEGLLIEARFMDYSTKDFVVERVAFRIIWRRVTDLFGARTDVKGMSCVWEATPVSSKRKSLKTSKSF